MSRTPCDGLAPTHLAPLFEPPCFKFVVSKTLGYGIVAGSAAVKLPQVFNIVKAGSVDGLSGSAILIEWSASIASFSYYVALGYPFSTWGENFFLFFQNAIITTLYMRFTVGLASPRFVLTVLLSAALGTVLFAFGPHYNVVAVANELSQPSRARMLTVFVASQLGSLTIYTTLTVSAYLTFGKGIPGDVLLAYPQASLVVSVARLMLVFVVALSYPVVAFPLSQALHSLLTIIARAVGIPSAPRIADADDGAFHSDPMVLCAVTLVLSSTLVTALFVTSLGKVVSMAGGIGASIGCLILPGAAYAILVPKPRFALKRLGALLTLAIGLVVPPMLVVQNIE